jgi:hypothetical protein
MLLHMRCEGGLLALAKSMVPDEEILEMIVIEKPMRRYIYSIRDTGINRDRSPPPVYFLEKTLWGNRNIFCAAPEVSN